MRTRQSPRYRIETSSDCVVLTSSHPDVLAALGEYTADSIRRVYRVVGHSSGYVYDVTNRPGTLGLQVGDGLSNWGDMLMTSPARLRTTIARELRAALREYSRDVDGR